MPLTRRPYSRDGCQECKRRKLKCDEQKPVCARCAKGGKLCVYGRVVRFPEQYQFTLDDHPVLRDVLGTQIEHDLASEAYALASSITKLVHGPTTQNIPVPHPELSQGLHDEFSEDARSADTDSPATLSEMEFPALDTPMFDPASSVAQFIDSFRLLDEHRVYFDAWAVDLSQDTFPLALHPPDNPVRNLVIAKARQSPYLLAAILAVGARYVFFKTGNPAHWQARRNYLKVCLQNLELAFKNDDLRDLEALTFTVLTLTQDFLASRTSSWRNHLQGAKHLFIRHHAYIQLNRTPGLLCAKLNFVAIECVAGITDLRGGSIRDLAELDILLDIGFDADDQAMMKQAGLMVAGFNLFLGYSTEVLALYREVMKASERIRAWKRTNAPHTQLDTDTLLQLAVLAKAARAWVFIVREGPVPPLHPAHPAGPLPLPAPVYIYTTLGVFSMLDLSQQAHSDAGLLKVFTSEGFYGLPVSHPMVQEVVVRMLGYLTVIEELWEEGRSVFKPSPSLDKRFIMVQSSYLMCGLCCVTAGDRAKVAAYFAAIEPWCGLAHSSQVRLNRVWGLADSTPPPEDDTVPFC